MWNVVGFKPVLRLVRFHPIFQVYSSHFDKETLICIQCQFSLEGGEGSKLVLVLLNIKHASTNLYFVNRPNFRSSKNTKVSISMSKNKFLSTKHNNFLGVGPVLTQNLTNFVFPTQKLDNLTDTKESTVVPAHSSLFN